MATQEKGSALKNEGGIGCVYYGLVLILGVAIGVSVGAAGPAMLYHFFWRGGSGSSFYANIDSLPFSLVGGIIGGILGPIIGIRWLKAQVHK